MQTKPIATVKRWNKEKTNLTDWTTVAGKAESQTETRRERVIKTRPPAWVQPATLAERNIDVCNLILWLWDQHWQQSPAAAAALANIRAMPNPEHAWDTCADGVETNICQAYYRRLETGLFELSPFFHSAPWFLSLLLLIAWTLNSK